MKELYKQVLLNEGKDKSIKRMHPWLFSGAIRTKDNKIEEGDIVIVYSSKNEFLGLGFYQNDTIAVKFLSFENIEINQEFWNEKISKAIEYRKTLGFFDKKDSDIFRLINAEGDFLPGLIVDYYAGLLVVQFHSVGMYHYRKEIVNALVSSLGEENIVAIFNKSSSTLPKKGKVFSKDEFLYKTAQTPWMAKENGNTYHIDFSEGQKTGFFIDQRENRELLKSMSKGKNVLNAFGYTGGFSVAALKGEAKYVETLDISKKAIEICNQNVEMNFGEKAPHEALAVDVLDYLDSIPEDKFDIIVLDPPAFAKNIKSLQQGLKGYRTINQKAIEKVAKGGFIFTFSCSQAVSKEDFGTMLFASAATTGRKVRIIQRLPHAIDHPQSIYHPEGEYLKGILLYVE
ncbi:MAG: hypothetical protein H6Q15_972 [Bacteroidetes bacterium]|nr:hypothetical protein [Bacteroidota bacterium]